MQKSKIKLHYLVPSLAALIISFLIVSVARHTTEAQTTGTTCPTYFMLVDNSTAPPTVLSGLHSLTLLNSTSSSVQSVYFTIDSIPLGRGQASGSSGWSMPWYTQAAVSGGHNIGANVQLDTGLICPATTRTVMTNNSTVVPIMATATPPFFNAQTNEAIDITLISQLNAGSSAPVDVTNYTIFQKNAPSLGTISPLDVSSGFRYSSGTVPGNSSINAVAYYGGASRPISIPVTIYQQTTTSTATSPRPNDAPLSPITKPTITSAPTTVVATTTPASTSTSASIESDPVTKSCVITGLTQSRYLEISTGKSRPTAAEFEAINRCFADRNYVLPTGFVPVAPDKVSQLPQTTDTKIAGATNQLKKTSTSSIKTLQFAGKTTPGSTVILYIHSEPLVVSTQADKNGDWNYSLEDPLESGKHEVYAVVNKSDGTYQRSGVFDFVIAKAEATALNPKGYSLKVETIKPTATENNRPKVIYISASLGLIVFVLGSLVVALHFYNKRHVAVVTPGQADQYLTIVTPDPPADSQQQRHDA